MRDFELRAVSAESDNGVGSGVGAGAVIPMVVNRLEIILLLLLCVDVDVDVEGGEAERDSLKPMSCKKWKVNKPPAETTKTKPH